MSFAPIGIGLIFCLIVFAIYNRHRREIALSRLGKVVLVIAIVTGIVDLIAGIIYISSTLFPTYPWSQIPIPTDLIWSFFVIFVISVSIVVTVYYRKSVEHLVAECFREKLERKIRKELETEAIAKNLIFPRQLKDGISRLARRESCDIMSVPTPIDYSVQPMNDRDGDVEVYLGGDIIAISFSQAEILAHKMTELSKNPKYRGKSKWLYLFWVR